MARRLCIDGIAHIGAAGNAAIPVGTALGVGELGVLGLVGIKIRRARARAALQRKIRRLRARDRALRRCRRLSCGGGRVGNVAVLDVVGGARTNNRTSR